MGAIEKLLSDNLACKENARAGCGPLIDLVHMLNAPITSSYRPGVLRARESLLSQM